MNLQPGDLILYPVNSKSDWISRLVGWGQKLIHQAPSQESYSHVAIAGPDTAHMYEAYWPKIRVTNIRLQEAEIFRIKDITPEQVARMLDYCKSHVGEWYDLLGILTLGKIQIGGTKWCSQYAYYAALAAFIVLCPPEDVESPDDIAASPLLVRL